MAKQKLDVQGIVSHLGGPTELARKLVRRGHNINVKTINMWVYRKRIPGDWITVLVTDLKLKLQNFPAVEDDLEFLD